MNAHAEVPARRSDIRSLIAEYEAKREAIPGLIEEFRSAASELETGSTVRGRYVASIWGRYGSPSIREDVLQENLLKGAWQEAFHALHLDKIAPAGDRGAKARLCRSGRRAGRPRSLPLRAWHVMPRELSQETRALIDKAEAEGRVTRIEDPGPPKHTKPISRKRRVGLMHHEGVKVAEMAEREGVSPATIYNDLRSLGLMAGGDNRTSAVVEVRRHAVRQMNEAGKTLAAMARALNVSTATIASDKRALGIQRQGVKRGATDKIGEKRKERVQKKVAALKDRRRFQIAVPAIGKAAKLASDEACEEGRTMFPERVFLPPGPEVETVLKDGSSNSKIGGDVLVGRLKGAYIATLTLQERATCPESCGLWRECYGNNMQWSRRWAAGPELEASLRIEVAEACAANENVLIRLHILGDFYSQEYVRLWADLLHRHPNLHVFGFTAWPEKTQIGAEIAALREMLPFRFMIRHSGRTGRWGSAILPIRPDPDIDGGWPKMIGDAIVCPEQRDAYLAEPQSRHCGNCAACWSTDAPILFVLH